MKRISGPQYFFRLFTNSALQEFPLTALSLCECKLVFSSVLRCVYIGRIYGLIAQSLKLIINTGHVKMMGDCKSDSFEQAQIFTVKEHRSSQILQLFCCYLYLSLSDRWFIFTKQILFHYFELLFAGFCRSFLK